MQQAPNFNRLAPIYHWLEYLTFGPFLHRSRTCFLPRFTDCRRALVLGDGDGRFTAALLRANPTIRVTAIDASPAMLVSLVERSSAHTGRLTTQLADLRSWTPTPNPKAPFDLIATHFFLDCLSTEEIARLASRIAPALAANALWVISDFAIPSTAFGRFAATPLVWLLYRLFRLLTGLRQQSLPDHPSALSAAGWAPYRRASHLSGLLISELWVRTGTTNFP